MVIIELAEEETPEFEKRPPKKEGATGVTPKATPIEAERPPAVPNDSVKSSEDEYKDAKPQPQKIHIDEKPLEAEATAGRPDETLTATTAESAQQLKPKKKGDLPAEVEGDGWETASEGGSDTDEKEATTSGNHDEHFEDALTEEQLRERALVQANAAKVEGNSLYASGKYMEALDRYTAAIEGITNDPTADELRAQCYSNRAICEINLKNYAAAVKESSKALELDPNYVKALMRRAQANENLEKFEEALIDLKKVIEIDPANKPARASIIRLEPIVAQKREELKEEMIGKLKDLGNSVLGKFGMSVDDFKAVKDPNTGSYSISFGKS